MSIVILANGRFPTHIIPLEILKNASKIVCCDGAVNSLQSIGLEPFAVVGDLDSLSDELRAKYFDRLYHDSDQESNDLTKTVKWCYERGFININILAATGLREDHTIGNISLLTSYAKMGIDVDMITDHGVFTPILKSTKFISYKGQSVSVFSQLNSVRVTTHNLEFPIENRELPELWTGTLNRSLGDWFEITFEKESLLVFRSH